MYASSRGYFKLAFITTLLALVVVMLGAYTRLSDAGLGCPDWPGCYGHLTVPQTNADIMKAESAFQQTVEPAKAWKEMVHRYFAGFLGILIATLSAWGFARRLHDAHQPIVTPIILLLLVIFQAVLGMWTVTWLVLPLIVTAHLLGGMAIVALLWYLTLVTRPNPPYVHTNSKFRFWVILGLLILIIQIFLGAWTSTNYAAIICIDFPFCNGKLFPPMDVYRAFDFSHPIGVNYEGGILDVTTRTTIQMFHRYGAFITAVYWGILGICLLFSPALRDVGGTLLVILTIQFSLGVANIEWMLPMPIAVLHNGMAAILLLTVVTLVYKLYRKSP